MVLMSLSFIETSHQKDLHILQSLQVSNDEKDKELEQMGQLTIIEMPSFYEAEEENWKDH
jgi:hypothetical protein